MPVSSRALLFTALTLFADLQRGQGVPPPPATGTGAISGTVVDSATERPLAGAIVQLTGIPASGVAGNPSGVLRQTRVSTDDQGRFVFTRLPAADSYYLGASKFGYFDGSYGRPATSIAGSTRRIALTEGQWIRDARIDLIKPATISGIVTDDGGSPLVSVTVRAYAEIQIAGVRHLASSIATATDDRGMYRLANLIPGSYLVAVPSVQHAVPASLSAEQLAGTTPPPKAADALGREGLVRRDPAFAIDPFHRLVLTPNSPPVPPSPTGKPHVYPMTFHPSSQTPSEASAIQVRSGDDRSGVNVRLRSVPAFRLSGRLEGPPNQVAGMSVRLMLAGCEALGRGSEHATALVSGDGTFTFLNVPNGAYTIIASRTLTEYQLQRLGPVSPYLAPPPGARFTSMQLNAVATGPPGALVARHEYDGSQKFHGRQTVTVNGRDVGDAVVQMQASVAMWGRFVYEDAAGMPAAPRPIIAITAEPANGDLAAGQPVRRMDPDDPPNYFYMDGFLPGPYILQIPLRDSIKSITWNNKDFTDTPIEVTGESDVKDVVITVTQQTTTISGTIRTRQGQPAATATAIVFPADRARWINFGRQPIRIRSTQASTVGVFTFQGLPAGDYFILGVDDAKANWTEAGFFDAASRFAVRISLAWGEKKAQDLVLQDVR